MGKTKVVGKDVKLELEEFAKTRSKHRGVRKKGGWRGDSSGRVGWEHSQRLAKSPIDRFSPRKMLTMYRQKLPKWLGRLLCRLALHDFRVDVTFGFGVRVEHLECRRCGLTAKRQG